MEEKELISCLRNEKVIARFIPRNDANITNPGHVLYGGMAESSAKYFTVPVLASTGTFKNVLTDSEKAFLEDIMGLDYNALSIYKKENNFWANYQVRLIKSDNYLDLSDPSDYIKYKVLLANSDSIAPSLEELEKQHKATYQFVLIKEGEHEKIEKNKISAIMKCYKKYGKYEDDIDVLRHVVETLDKRPLAKDTSLEFLQGKSNELIQKNAEAFLSVIDDVYLNVKVLIRKAVIKGVIVKKGDYYYLREGNAPLCSNNENPTFATAAKYLALPKNQELKLTIETQIKE